MQPARIVNPSLSSGGTSAVHPTLEHAREMMRVPRPTSRGLSTRHLNVLDFVRRFTVAHGYAPTMREIADEFSMHIEAVRRALHTLERHGKLTLEIGTARSIRVLAPEAT